MRSCEYLIKCGITPLADEYLPLSEEQVQELEDRFGVFPPEYREIVMKYGGALFDRAVYYTPIDQRFKRIAPGGSMTIDCIYGAISDDDRWDPNSLLANIENTRERMPDTMIPIAASGNDHICLGLSGADRNLVYYWDREEEPTVDYNNLYLIAHSFDEFLASLCCEA
jgi:hypothetical protein